MRDSNPNPASNQSLEQNITSLSEALKYAESIVETFHEPLIVLNPDLTVKSCNRAFYENFKVRAENTIGRRIYDLGNGQWNIPALRKLLEDVLPDSKVFNDYELKHDFEDIGRRVMLLNARRLDHVQLILLGIRDITERQQAEEALRKSEERFRALATATFDVVYTMNADWTEMCHLEGGEFIPDTNEPSRTWLDKYIYPDDQPLVMETVRRAIESKSTFELEHRVIRVDGTLGWTHSRATPILNERGEITEWFGAASDVTARKETESALRESEQRLELALQAGRSGTWEWDLVNNVGTVSPSYRQLYGFPPDKDVDYQTWLNSVYEEDRERCRRYGEEVFRSGTEWRLQYRAKTPHMGLRWHESVGRIERDAAGKPVRFIGVSSDITERKEAEEGLRRSEEQYRELVEQVKDYAIFRIDLEGRSMTWNEGVQRVLGYSEEEFVGTNVTDEIFTPEDVKAGVPDQELQDAGRFGTASNDRWMRRKDGTRFYAHGTTSGLKDQTGAVVGFTKVMRDHTPLKEAEEALRNLSQSLEAQVSERTIELQRQAVRLRRLASELASAEQRERKRLAALLHDDLQQSLIAAKISLNYAREFAADSDAAEEIERASGMLEEAINTSRGLTRQLRPPALYEGGLVAALHWLASEMERMHRMRFVITETEPLPRLSDDARALLFECVRELMLNAAKHSGSDEVEVTVNHDDSMLRLTVEDRGTGFDVDALSEEGRIGGFGLFSIRERLAALHGVMSIQSRDGKGTRVELTVPKLSLLPVQEREKAFADEGPVADIREGQRRLDEELVCRVLIADDHPIVREGIANVLNRDARIDVIAQAGDGIEAMEAIERHRPELVLLDVNMPRMNGIDAAREIHRRWPEIAIIGLSVQDDDATAKAMKDAGACDFIPKSEDPNKMISTIVRLGSCGESRN